ncbi:MAG: hypothetical protein RL385_1473 [Pseudomonadota bacterium]|jgi:serine/threonine-protein kinase
MGRSTKRANAEGDLPCEIANGKYRLLRLIARGGMGEVYEAEQSLTHKRVAIKSIRGDLATRTAVERLGQEARGSALVRHPNVVDVYDLLLEDDTAFLVMEYLEGETLGAAISRGDVPPHRLVALLISAMRGVAAAHAKGVVHRDIKPDNIFLAKLDDTPEPVVKVLDFGICKLRAATEDGCSLTRSGQLLGTPHFMSFEQLNGSASIDGRADVYAFGVTLYLALTGRHPFDASTLAALVVQISTMQPVLPHVLCPDLPEALSRLVVWAMARSPEDRIPDLATFIRELEPFGTAVGFARERDASSSAVGPSMQSAQTLDTDSVAPSAVTPRGTARSLSVPAKRNRVLVGSLAVGAGLVLTGVVAMRDYARVPALPAAAANALAAPKEPQSLPVVPAITPVPQPLRAEEPAPPSPNPQQVAVAVKPVLPKTLKQKRRRRVPLTQPAVEQLSKGVETSTEAIVRPSGATEVPPSGNRGRTMVAAEF